MTTEAALLLSLVLISGGATVALWSFVRVLILRQDLYNLRDELFDCALTLGAFDDPAYVRARDTLNVLARSARRINLPAVIYLLIAADAAEYREPRPTSPRPEVQRFVDRAYQRLSLRLLRYLILENGPGWILMLGLLPILLTAVVIKPMHQLMQRKMEGLVRSSLPDDLYRYRAAHNVA